MAPGTDPLQLIIKGRFPDRSYWLPHIHDRLRKVVKKAMHVDPNRRYADERNSGARWNKRGRMSPGGPRAPRPVSAGMESPQTARHGAQLCEPKVKGGYRFAVERRLLGKSWRGKSADALDTATEADAAAHAHAVLSRIAVEGG